MQDYSKAKREYDAVESALKMVKQTGYGFASASLQDIQLSKPEVVKQGSLHVRHGGFGRAPLHHRASPVDGEPDAGRPAQLSGGGQRRVAIARAVATNPKILLCDEPTGALDYNTGKQVLQILQDQSRKKGATVVIVTHNSAIAPIADRPAFHRLMLSESPSQRSE